MTAPVIQSVQYNGTLLYIIFDRAVSGVSDLGAFTFTVTPGPTIITPAFAAIDENAVIGTLVAPLGPGESLTVDYTDPGAGPTQVLEAVAPNDPATSFSGQLATAVYTPPTVRRAEVAADGSNDSLTIFFSEPVGSTDGDLITGLTIEVDDLALDLSGATASLNDDQTELTISTGTNFSYNDTVDVIYDLGTGALYSWPTGAIASFTLNDIQNNSTDGLPDSQYPNSFVTQKKLEITAGVVEARLQISLNPVDIELAQKYGPLTVNTGGTFGQTVDNPSGLSVVGATSTILDGAEISQTFTSPTIKFATDAAADWQDQVTTLIGTRLGQARADDQSITLADDTIEAV